MPVQEFEDDLDLLAYCEQELVRAGATVDHLPGKAVEVTFPDGRKRGFAGWRFALICLDTLTKVAAEEFGE